MKIVELALRGMTPEEAVKKGMYNAKGNGHEHDWADAIAYYKNNPSELKRDMKSVAIYKGAVTTFLENTGTGIEGVDLKNRTLAVVRTEGPFHKLTIDSPGHYGIACSESSCHGRIKEVYSGDNVIVTKVPFSRVMGCYWWEGRAGSNKTPYLSDHEQEIVCDTFGSPYKKFYAGRDKCGGGNLTLNKAGYDEAVRMYKDFIKKHGDKI